MFFILLISAAFQQAGAQEVKEIYFHLYTDSLKKGFFNYINVDGKTADGKWLPLTSEEVIFSVTDTLLKFEKNDLFIDSAYLRETVVVKAALRSNPKIWKEVTIYIRKRGFDELLPTNEELFEQIQADRKKKRKN